MAIYRYEELGENQMDVFREIGSIGNGNAITALSGILSEKISMELPEVNILEFNMAQNKIGDAEEIVGAVLVEMSGELSGLMMLILKRDFIKTMIKKVLSYEKENLLDMEEIFADRGWKYHAFLLYQRTLFPYEYSDPFVRSAVCRQYAGRDLKHAYGNDGN